MSDRPDGGSAFPLSSTGYPGMSLRDWFAGQALAGPIAGPAAILLSGPPPDVGSIELDLADRAFVFADAMLERRKS